MKNKKGNALALAPIGVFLILYLGLGILFEYVMKIPMGFYNVPIVVAFLAAILVACLQNRTVCFDRKIKPKSDYPLKTLYPRAFQTGQNHLIYYDFTTVE